MSASTRDRKTRGAESLKLIGGLVALGSGLFVIAAISAVAIIADNSAANTIATGAFGVVGSIVGAYFGVKIGSDGTRDAVQGQREEAAKAQVFAAHLSDGKAEVAIQQALQAADQVKAPKG
jgi:hypothetical protein